MKVSALGVEEQRVNVLIDFEDPSAAGRLGDGYRVEVRVVIWREEDVVKVPVGALFRRGNDWAAFLVDGDQVRLQPVELGQRNEVDGQVLKGLSPDQTVVLHPPDTLDGWRAHRRAPELMATECIPNIGPRERRRRTVGGVVFLLVTCASVDASCGSTRRARGVCSSSCQRGRQRLGFFKSPRRPASLLPLEACGTWTLVTSRSPTHSELERVRAQSRRVHIRAALSAAVIAALLTFLPI